MRGKGKYRSGCAFAASSSLENAVCRHVEECLLAGGIHLVVDTYSIHVERLATGTVANLMQNSLTLIKYQVRYDSG